MYYQRTILLHSHRMFQFNYFSPKFEICVGSTVLVEEEEEDEKSAGIKIV